MPATMPRIVLKATANSGRAGGQIEEDGARAAAGLVGDEHHDGAQGETQGAADEADHRRPPTTISRMIRRR